MLQIDSISWQVCFIVNAADSLATLLRLKPIQGLLICPLTEGIIVKDEDAFIAVLGPEPAQEQ